MDLQEVGCRYMDWFGLAQDRDSWRTLLSAVMNIWVPWNGGNFLTSCKPVSFSRRTVRHGMNKYSKIAVIFRTLTALHCGQFVKYTAWIRRCGAYTGCPRRNVPDFGRVFLMLNYTDITQNIYIQSWTVTEIMAREVWNFDSCYSLIDCRIHIETGRNMWFL